MTRTRENQSIFLKQLYNNIIKNKLSTIVIDDLIKHKYNITGYFHNNLV